MLHRISLSILVLSSRCVHITHPKLGITGLSPSESTLVLVALMEKPKITPGLVAAEVYAVENTSAIPSHFLVILPTEVERGALRLNYLDASLCGKVVDSYWKTTYKSYQGLYRTRSLERAAVI